MCHKDMENQYVYRNRKSPSSLVDSFLEGVLNVILAASFRAENHVCNTGVVVR